jgi:hypothetical protein
VHLGGISRDEYSVWIRFVFFAGGRITLRIASIALIHDGAMDDETGATYVT